MSHAVHSSSATRIDHDTIGEVAVPANALWSAQTQRSLDNFKIGGVAENMPLPLIHSLALIKAAAARANYPAGDAVGSVIEKAALEVAAGLHDAHFPLKIWQTGSGTQTNMNVNEVIANRANQLLGLPLGQWSKVHPNDHVNKSQSSNDTFPTGMHVCLALALRNQLLPALARLRAVFTTLSERHKNVIKIGRTHLQDATPLTVGQQFTSYAHQLTLSLRRLCPLLACPEPVALPLKAGDGVNKDGDDDTVPAPAFSVPRYALMPDPINAGADLDNTAAYSANGGGQAQWPPLLALAQGGTAVGTGLNTAKGFDVAFCDQLRAIVNHHDTTNNSNANAAASADCDFVLPFYPAENKFAALASHDCIVELSGLVTAAATGLHKIANDLRYLASGPRAGLGELTLPANEPGSSIMPGKVNPTQCEALTMVCTRVVGNNATVAMAGASGQFELNVYKPVIVATTLQSIQLLADATESFTDNCAVGIQVNEDRIDSLMRSSLMLVTALNPRIGYENAARVAKLAFKENCTLREAAVDKLQLLSNDEFDKYVDPRQMLGPK